MPLVYHIFAPRFLKCGAESADILIPEFFATKISLRLQFEIISTWIKRIDVKNYENKMNQSSLLNMLIS